MVGKVVEVRAAATVAEVRMVAVRVVAMAVAVMVAVMVVVGGGEVAEVLRRWRRCWWR